MIKVPDKYKIKDGNIRDVLKQLEELRVDKEERLENASDERAEQLQSEIDELTQLIGQATEDIKKLEASKAADEAKKEAARKSANMVAAGEVTDDEAGESKKHNIPMVDDGRGKSAQGGAKSGNGNEGKFGGNMTDGNKAGDKKDDGKKQDTSKAERERAKADAEHEKDLVAKAKALQKEGKKAQDAEDKKAASEAKKAADDAKKAAAQAAAQAAASGNQNAQGPSFADAMQQGATAMMNKDYKTANERFSLVANAPTRGKDVPTEAQRAEAMFFLGKIFEQGLGVSVDKKRALYWYEESAKLGYIEACKECGMEYTLRKPQNLTEDAENVRMALHYFGIAAEKGNADAKTKYIQACEQRTITKAQLNKALGYCDDFMNAEQDKYVKSQWKDRKDKLKAKFKETGAAPSTAAGGFSLAVALSLVGSIMTILGCLYMTKAYAYNTNFEFLKFKLIPNISILSNKWSMIAELYGEEYSVSINELFFCNAISMLLLGRFFEEFAKNKTKLLDVCNIVSHVFMSFTLLFMAVIARYYMGYVDGDYALLLVFMALGTGIGRWLTGLIGGKLASMLKIA